MIIRFSGSGREGNFRGEDVEGRGGRDFCGRGVGRVDLRGTNKGGEAEGVGV